MAYNLIVTERADELVDLSVGYLVNRLKNPKAAVHLMDGISEVYSRLADNPYQFPESKDEFLAARDYRVALIADMDYKMVFRVDEKVVYIVGLFHDLEDYVPKIKE